MAGEVLTWVEPDGTTHALNYATAGIGLRKEGSIGRNGAFMPPVAFVEDLVPNQAGSRLRAVRIRPREVDLPIYCEAADEATLRTTLRSILGWFDPQRGDGTFRVQAPGGDVRQLVCRYAGGLEMVESGQQGGVTWQQFVLILRAVDPYWYAPNAISKTYLLATATTSFFPIFPLRLSGSTVFADDSVVNGGDVEAWPVWTVVGPGSSIYLRNLTTGQFINVNTTLATGEILTVDTRPGKKSIKKSDGTNLFGSMSSDSAMWSFARGTTAIRVEMASSTVDSSVSYSYFPRYLGV